MALAATLITGSSRRVGSEISGAAWRMIDHQSTLDATLPRTCMAELPSIVIGFQLLGAAFVSSPFSMHSAK